ncbi:hypothetical protein GYH30_040296 [Glycine max]|nr:hypothetical protein GYH30_040296 [Glycine max]
MSLQVVDALTDIVEGRTCDIILRDYSPARLDSTYTTSGSDESEDEMQEPLRFEGELLSHSSESIESNNISQMMHMIVHIVQRGVVQPLIEMLQSPDV